MELEEILNEVTYEYAIDTRFLEAVPGQIVNIADFDLDQGEEKKQVLSFVKEPNSAKEKYAIIPILNILLDVIIGDQNIRPFTKYDMKEKDFLIDFHHLYHCSSIKFRLDYWHALKGNLLLTENNPQKENDLVSIDFVEHIINRDIQQLCITPAGTWVAHEWYCKNKDEAYRFPDIPVNSIMASPRLSVDDFKRLHETMHHNRNIRNRQGRQM
jgi:hypothetical protein